MESHHVCAEIIRFPKLECSESESWFLEACPSLETQGRCPRELISSPHLLYLFKFEKLEHDELTTTTSLEDIVWWKNETNTGNSNRFHYKISSFLITKFPHQNTTVTLIVVNSII